MTESNKPRELLPCPFCGGEADYRVGNGNHFVICWGCGCNTDNYQTKAEAIKAWNTRLDNLEAELEELRKYKAEFNPPFIKSLEDEITKWWEATMERRAKLTAVTKELDEANELLGEVSNDIRDKFRLSQGMSDEGIRAKIEAHLSSLDQQGEKR